MKKKKLSLKYLLLGGLLLLSCGCKQDSMEDISIVTTNYPNEFIIEKLYGKHATITSAYPDGVDPQKYKLTKKQKQNFAEQDLFIYTGLIERERDLAVNLLDYNNDLKIIDSSYVLENDYDTDEIWIDPSFMLMMSQNVRISLKEYVENKYLKEEIDKNYENLKVEVSELDANIRLAVEGAPYKTIVVADKAYKFLEKYGLKVYLLDDNTTLKEQEEIDDLIKKGMVTKIFSYENKKIDSNVQNMINRHPKQLEILNFKPIIVLDEEQRETKSDYSTLMTQNLDTLKEEIYHGTETTT